MAESDAALVKRVLAGEQESFRPLVERYQDAVYGVALSRTGSFADAEEIAQEAFLAAYEALEELRDPARFGSWLYGIALNTTRERLRGERRRRRREDAARRSPEGPERPDRRAEREEQRAEILTALKRLPEARREAATLYYIDGYSTADISRFTGRPTGTIKRRLHEARNQLRRELVAMVEQELKQSRPAKEFTNRVLRSIDRMRAWPETDGVFVTDSEGRSFSIGVGAYGKSMLEPWLAGKGSPDALDIYTATVRALRALGCQVRSATIDPAAVGYVGMLSIRSAAGRVEVHCPAGDAINLAARADAKVFVEEELATERGIARKDGKPMTPPAAWRHARKRRREEEGRSRRFRDMAEALRALEEDTDCGEARVAVATAARRPPVRRSIVLDDTSHAWPTFKEWADGCRGTEFEGLAAGLLGAVCLYQRDEPEEAIPHLEAAHELAADDERIAFDLATAYTWAGRADEAISVLKGSGGWHHELTKPRLCGNFHKLWDDPRFRQAAGEPEPRCARYCCLPQLCILRTVGPSPVPRKPGFYGTQTMATKKLSAQQVRGIQEALGTDELLLVGRVSGLSRGDDVDRGPWLFEVAAERYVMFDLPAKRAAAAQVSPMDAQLLFWGFVPFPDREPETPLALCNVLEGAGISIVAACLTAATEPGVEGRLVVRKSRQQEVVAIDGIAGVAIALARDRPILLTEELAKKLYVRGKNGRPLTPKGARTRLLAE